MLLPNDGFQGPEGRETHSSHKPTCKLSIKVRERTPYKLPLLLVFIQKQSFVVGNLNYSFTTVAVHWGCVAMIFEANRIDLG